MVGRPPAGTVKQAGQQVPEDVREQLVALKRASDARANENKSGPRRPRADYEYHQFLSYLAALNRHGWTATALSKALGLSRERVRQLSAREYTIVTVSSLPLGELPVWEDPEPAYRPLTLNEYEVERLKTLAAVKAKRRNGAGPDHPTTVAMRDFNALVEKLWDRGVSTYMMAKQTGLSHGMYAQSLMRVGRIDAPPSLRDSFRPIDATDLTPARDPNPNYRLGNRVMLTTATVKRIRLLVGRRRMQTDLSKKREAAIELQNLLRHLYNHDKVAVRTMSEQTGFPISTLEQNMRRSIEP